MGASDREPSVEEISAEVSLWPRPIARWGWVTGAGTSETGALNGKRADGIHIVVDGLAMDRGWRCPRRRGTIRGVNGVMNSHLSVAVITVLSSSFGLAIAGFGPCDELHV
jgi:hypothetical protein